MTRSERFSLQKAEPFLGWGTPRPVFLAGRKQGFAGHCCSPAKLFLCLVCCLGAFQPFRCRPRPRFIVQRNILPHLSIFISTPTD